MSIKSRSLLLVILLFTISFSACSKKSEQPQTDYYTNTVNYGVYNQDNSIIDVGTSLTNSKYFSGRIEVNQDMKGSYNYYLNVLSNGKEIPYTLDDSPTLSATKFEISDKGSFNKKLTITNLIQGEEIVMLLFKYPTNQSTITVESSLLYSVMGLRFNVGDPAIPKEFRINNATKKRENNPDLVLVEPDTSPVKIAINQSPSTKVQLTIGKNDDQNDIPDRNYILAFLNGRQIDYEDDFSRTVYEVPTGTSIDVPVTLPTKEDTQNYGNIFQIVSIMSPFEMTNGINSQTNINFTNPIHLSNS
ncbi:hypothetical protein [Enterococcus faecalis]|uniref:hypothetical protein n=1 Tax=Enterococcus faecalis TaxID=1351 RepID=UPI002DB71F9D|nr:hypothetical protein [Enterococcus faecalis]MEB7792076.1 hypothetical protein [Enterococcus faecalis]MEB7810064.1 hypothetical protein [Enterococcus faecalis]